MGGSPSAEPAVIVNVPLVVRERGATRSRSKNAAARGASLPIDVGIGRRRAKVSSSTACPRPPAETTHYRCDRSDM